jgi:DNA excision repair protein ERCC-4
MGVRDPGFRVLTYEMSITQRYRALSEMCTAALTGREEMYRGGGLFSVTSKILVNDFLSEYDQ